MRQDDELDAEDRALVTQLRELPPDGVEPDWRELEAAIRAEVGDAAPRPWWRNWRWIVPVWALATTAVVALLVMRADKPAEQRVVEPARDDAGVDEPQPPAPTETTAPTAMWLDGEVVEIDDVSGAALDELDAEARALLAPPRVAEPQIDDDDVPGGILPVADYGWIDTLDDEAVDRADAWLKRNRS
jgi:hypothetical protein